MSQVRRNYRFIVVPSSQQFSSPQNEQTTAQGNDAPSAAQGNDAISLQFKCTRCHSVFDSMALLKIHSSQCQKPLPQPEAPVCIAEPVQVVETYTPKINGRIVTYDPSQTKTCHICGKQLKDEYTLKTHMNTHTSDRPFQCGWEGCTYSFKTKGSLKRHIRRHTNDRPFQCEMCHRTFRESGALSRHLKSRTPCTSKKDTDLPLYGKRKRFNREEDLSDTGVAETDADITDVPTPLLSEDQAETETISNAVSADRQSQNIKVKTVKTAKKIIIVKKPMNMNSNEPGLLNSKLSQIVDNTRQTEKSDSSESLLKVNIGGKMNLIRLVPVSKTGTLPVAAAGNDDSSIIKGSEHAKQVVIKSENKHEDGNITNSVSNIWGMIDNIITTNNDESSKTVFNAPSHKTPEKRKFVSLVKKNEEPSGVKRIKVGKSTNEVATIGASHAEDIMVDITQEFEDDVDDCQEMGHEMGNEPSEQPHLKRNTMHEQRPKLKLEARNESKIHVNFSNTRQTIKTETVPVEPKDIKSTRMKVSVYSNINNEMDSAEKHKSSLLEDISSGTNIASGDETLVTSVDVFDANNEARKEFESQKVDPKLTARPVSLMRDNLQSATETNANELKISRDFDEKYNKNVRKMKSYVITNVISTKNTDKPVNPLNKNIIHPVRNVNDDEATLTSLSGDLPSVDDDVIDPSDDVTEIELTDGGDDVDSAETGFDVNLVEVETSDVMRGVVADTLEADITDVNAITCEACGKRVAGVDKMKRHLKTHLRNDEYKCPAENCRCSLSTADALATHLEVVHGAYNIKVERKQEGLEGPEQKEVDIDTANRALKQLLELQGNLDTVMHTIGSQAVKVLHACPVCARTFPLNYLKLHIRAHTGERPFKCSMCGSSFRTKDQLTKHMSVHSDTRSFKCGECNKMFKRLSHIREHLKVHSNVRKYPCSHCDKYFKTSNACKVHMRTHSDVLPHRCSTCGKHFREKNALDRHYRTHTGEKPYTCKHCGRGFAEHGTLNRHLRAKVPCVQKGYKGSYRELLKATTSKDPTLHSARQVKMENDELSGSSEMFISLQPSGNSGFAETLHRSKTKGPVDDKDNVIMTTSDTVHGSQNSEATAMVENDNVLEEFSTLAADTQQLVIDGTGETVQVVEVGHEDLASSLNQSDNHIQYVAGDTKSDTEYVIIGEENGFTSLLDTQTGETILVSSNELNNDIPEKITQ